MDLCWEVVRVTVTLLGEPMREANHRKPSPVPLAPFLICRGDESCAELQILLEHSRWVLLSNADLLQQSNVPIELLVVSDPALNRSTIMEMSCLSGTLITFSCKIFNELYHMDYTWECRRLLSLFFKFVQVDVDEISRWAFDAIGLVFLYRFLVPITYWLLNFRSAKIVVFYIIKLFYSNEVLDGY